MRADSPDALGLQTVFRKCFCRRGLVLTQERAHGERVGLHSLSRLPEGGRPEQESAQAMHLPAGLGTW